jgi:hypothetical protein
MLLESNEQNNKGALIMEKTFTEDASLIELANKVISEHSLAYMNAVKAKYVLVGPNISKTVHGRCIKANNELRHFGNLDFLIEFSEEIWGSLDDKTRYILMYHELRHVLVKLGKEEKQTFGILDHDIKDFYDIIKEFGVDWFKQFKDIVAATYEIEGADKDKIKI